MDFSAFERAYANIVFKDKSVLSPSYVPPKLVCRKEEEFRLTEILFLGVKGGFLPPMVRVFGKPGSGKTVVVKSVLEEFSKYRWDVFCYFYVNLKNCRTVFSAGNAVLSAVCGRKVAVNLGLDRVFMELWTAVEELKKNQGLLFFVFVLDEADSIFFDKRYDASDFFYRILRASSTIPGLRDANFCVITITNNLKVFEDNLDARVKSSMGSESIFFSGYSQEALEEILKSRVNDAFNPNKVTDEVLSYCAQLAAEAGGDARRAIELLRLGGENTYAAYGKVKKDSIRRANKDEGYAVNEILWSLPKEAEMVTFLLAFYALNTEKTVTTREFYSYYSRMRFGKGLKKLGQRRVLDIINDLDRCGVVVARNVSKGRGGYRKEITFAVDPQIVIDHYRSSSYGFTISGPV